MKNIRVVLVESLAVVRDCLKALLEIDAGISIVGEAIEGKEAVRLTSDLRPDVVIMDLATPGCSGPKIIRQMQKIIPQIKVILIPPSDDQEYQTTAVSARLSKSDGINELINTIRNL